LEKPPLSLLDGAALFLDFDGTLVELAPEPGAVAVDAALVALLERLIDRLDGRVALLSGRSLVDVDRLVRPLALAIGASHGLEQSVPGASPVPPARPEGLAEAIAMLRELERDHPGVMIEEKPAGAAIHYRLAPHARSACHLAAERTALAIGMAIQHGKMVVELKPVGADKGSALRSFMGRSPFAGSRPLFIGDDLTDEHGFVAVRDLGGTGVLVGGERDTAATHRLDDVAAVRAWLAASLEALP